MRCNCCDTENNFQIFDYDRLGPPHSGKYEAMLICNICNSSMSVKIENIRYEKKLLKILKEATRPCQGGYITGTKFGHITGRTAVMTSAKKSNSI